MSYMTSFEPEEDFQGFIRGESTCRLLTVYVEIIDTV